MTREEALEVIKSHPFLFASFPDDVIEALDVLIKQEPVFDKIYAEIEELQRAMLYASKVEFNDIYKILDKYKAEQEGT